RATPPSRPRRSTTGPTRSTPRPSLSWSPATRTTRAWCCCRSTTSPRPPPTDPPPHPAGPARSSEPLFDLTRQLDPTRPVGFVNELLAAYGRCRVSRFGDVLMLNRYYGWYVHTGDLEAAERASGQELKGWRSCGNQMTVN